MIAVRSSHKQIVLKFYFGVQLRNFSDLTRETISGVLPSIFTNDIIGSVLIYTAGRKQLIEKVASKIGASTKCLKLPVPVAWGGKAVGEETKFLYTV